MSTQPPPGANGQPNSNDASGEPLIPLEPTIWKRYSSHHEFPLSILGSVVLHFFVVLMVAMMVSLYLVFGASAGPPEIENITFAGGGGSPDGDENSRVRPDEEVAFTPEITETETPIVNTEDLTTIITDPSEVIKKTREANEKIKVAKGLGGTGIGGGRGSGEGTGIGDGKGPGVQSAREKRKDRWVLNFSFRSGEDYLANLANLGAFIVIPEGSSKFRIYEDLRKRPLTGRSGTVEDVKKLNRIYWRDMNPDAVAALASALGLQNPPNYFWAFFPLEMEKELFAKELAFKGRTEAQLEASKMETIFQVDRQGGKFIVKVIDQRRRSDR